MVMANASWLNLRLVDRWRLRAPISGAGATALATTPGPVAFVVNRQGTRVAIQSIVTGDQPPGINAAVTQTPALPGNAVVVIDAGPAAIVRDWVMQAINRHRGQAFLSRVPERHLRCVLPGHEHRKGCTGKSQVRRTLVFSLRVLFGVELV